MFEVAMDTREDAAEREGKDEELESWERGVEGKEDPSIVMARCCRRLGEW